MLQQQPKIPRQLCYSELTHLFEHSPVSTIVEFSGKGILFGKPKSVLNICRGPVVWQSEQTEHLTVSEYEDKRRRSPREQSWLHTLAFCLPEM
jgi:hypothetical protein